MTVVSSGEGVRESVRALVPDLWATLVELVRLKSVSAGPPEPLAATAHRVAELFRAAGLPSADVITIEHGGRTSAPLVYANEEKQAGAKTVLLYAHYDVQPADAAQWHVTEPFTPKEVPDGDDTRLYGRGAADDKSGVVMHLGAVKALSTRGPGLPLNVKLVVEGEEETGESTLDGYLAEHPDDPRFQADVVVVADTGNLRLGAPTLTSTLRGIAVVDVELSTLERAVHSGMYGGPAPDAFMALTQVLAALLDRATGAVAVPGLADQDYPWSPVSEESFRADAGVLPGVRLIGDPDDSVAKRLYGRPSINVVGLSGVPGMDSPTNVLCPKATARVSMRLAPDQVPETALEALRAHLVDVTPWGLEAKITAVGQGTGFVAQRGAHHEAVEQSLRTAYGTATVEHAGQGGSIPLVAAFRAANPDADVVLWGCEEPRANIHGNDESVSRSELERMTLAEALLLQALTRP